MPMINLDSLSTPTTVVYQAVMPCPQCHSTDTSVRIVNGATSRGGVVLDVESVWTCATCKREFKPSRGKTMRPILMCSSCAVPMPHTLVGIEERQWVEPDGKITTVPFAVEMWRCVCGTQRVYGCA